MLKQTADALNDTLGQSPGRRDWGRALEGLKNDLGLPGNHHGRIMSTGDYVDDAGNVLGNLLDYVP
jgi:filamentous hemagglutinin